MKGTEKQIKWAQDIKDKFFRTIDLNISFYQEQLDKHPEVIEYQDDIDIFVNIKEDMEKALSHVDDAAKIIEMREMLSADRILFVFNEIKYKKHPELRG